MIPVVVNFRGDGTPIGQTGDRDPEQCDHAGGCWSTDLVMLCPQCGMQLFAPPRVLARRSRTDLTEMLRLWRLAGWPDISMRREFESDQHWTIVHHSLFAHVGGLPVRNNNLAAFLGG